MKNSGDSVLNIAFLGTEEAGLVTRFLTGQDFSPHTRRAFLSDMKKFAAWFIESNKEPVRYKRVTTRDLADFRDHLRRDKGQAVATVNRALVLLRSFLGWLADAGEIAANPAKTVKELRRQALAPKGMERSQVRRLLREIELRGDVRAGAIFGLLLYTGCRVGDLVGLELDDLLISERSGSVVYRHGKGGKQRSVPLPLPARRAIQDYLGCRPPIESRKVFIGERGPLTDRGIRAMCDKFSALIGVDLHPHLLRHTMAKRFLEDNQNDLVSLAQILGHESLNTTARYTRRSEEHLAQASERLAY